MEWIDVKDRMPEEETWVLVITDDGFMEVANVSYELWYDSNIYRIHGITHWMTLPEPPK